MELEQTNVDWRSRCQISSKLEKILIKMMSPTVEHRYHSALEVLQDLRPLLKIKQLVGGRYSITGYLGGNDGIETYLANNLRRQYQSPCVIKQIELPHSDDEGKIQLERRFVEELSVLERLGYHEQIPQLRDHFEENDEFYLVQEYIQGKSLAQKIAQKNLSTAEIVQILASTLSVLQFIHQNRLIHRNIKPSNLIVRELDRQVIITDFGILHEIKNPPNLSVDSRSSDRENYWSPEQAAGRPTISSDLYALGMSVIEALTETKPEMFTRDLTGKLLWSQNLALDRRLIRIIDKLIQFDLGQRYQSAQKVLSELGKINNYGNSPRQQSKIRLQDRKTASRQKRSGLPLLIGLLGFICLLGSIEFAFPTVRPLYYRYRGEKLLPARPQAAIDDFTKAIALKANNWQAWSGKGDALVARERYPQALEAYIEATELNPSVSANWQKRGDVLLRLDKFTEAIAAYNKALELEPENAAIYNRKGQALFELQQYEAALVMQDAALERDRLNPQFLSDRAQILFQLGRYIQALDLFNRVQAVKPNNLQLWQDKFFVLKALNRPQEAERLRKEINNKYIQITQQQPQEISSWIAQGDFLAATQMYGKAVTAYDEAIKLMPDNYAAWLGKSKALTQGGQEIRALDALKRTLQINPQADRAWQAKGLIQQKQNNLPGAIASYDRAIKINPNNSSLWRDRGIVLNQQGKYTQAIESLTKASELSSYDVRIWQELAIAWSTLGDDDQAILAIERGVKFYPQSSVLWSLKGSIQTRNGQYNQACETYRSARSMGGESTTIIDSMRQLGCRMNL
jgi:tetratricopeptide (TPR) repeat protein